MSWQDTPQQAIEDYLEALLHDDLTDDNPVEEKAAGRQEQEESLQARQLSESMLAFQQAPKTPAEALARPVQLDEPSVQPQVILPNLKMPEVEPAVETLADVVQEIETAQEVVQPLVEPKIKKRLKLNLSQRLKLPVKKNK